MLGARWLKIKALHGPINVQPMVVDQEVQVVNNGTDWLQKWLFSYLGYKSQDRNSNLDAGIKDHRGWALGRPEVWLATVAKDRELRGADWRQE